MPVVKEYFNPKTKQKYPIGGCIITDRSSKSPVIVVGASPFQHKKLAPSVDLRHLMTPVEYQGHSNSCSANAVAGLYEYLIKRQTGKHIDISRLFVYYNGRLKDGLDRNTMEDIGCSIPGVLQGMKDFGCCKEMIWKYILSSINRKPSYQSYLSAKNYLVQDYLSIPTNLITMKSYLANGYPFVFGLKLFKSFHRAAQNKGRVAIPNKNEPQSNDHGWHALVAVGYSDKSKAFIVRNSWGTQWGDKGYCYIPYVYMSNPDLCRDIYIIKSLSIKSHYNKKSISSNHQLICGAQQQQQLNENIHDEFDEKQCCKSIDTFNYYLGFESKRDVHQFVDSQYRYFILWIDPTNDFKQMISNKFNSNKLIKIYFCEKLHEGIEYLFENDDFIRRVNFQIVCRSSYPNENKTALDLLEMLDDLGLDHLPISLITRNRNLVEFHFNQQALTMDLIHWKQNIFITDQIHQLIHKIQLNFNL